jgi:hypothetical protein
VDEGPDIYRTEDGLAAVTSGVQRQILRALMEGNKQLPELVEVTGRSKPTLSSLHMKELMTRRLVEATPHPTDSRRKVYRITAQPVTQGAFAPAPGRPLALHVSVAAALASLCGPGAGDALLREQAARLGACARQAPWSPREMSLRLPAFLEENDLGVPIRIDLERGQVDLAVGGALRHVSECILPLLEGFLAGLAGRPGIAEARRIPEGVRLQVS